MKSTMTETKFLFFTVSSIILLMSVRIFQSQLLSIYNTENYLGIHTLLEIICIAISVTIFLYGLKYFSKTKSSRMLLLAFTFITIGSIDLLHTLSFKGMPFFITESSVPKATWFWVVARSLQSLLMVLLILVPDRKLKRDYRILAIFSGGILAAIAGFIIFSFEKSLPLLVIEGKGTTLLKNTIEYGVSFVLFISLVFCLYQYYINKSEENLYFALAFVFLLLTELIFTIYHSVYDLDNFLGHVYKVFGFYFILKGFYFSKEDLRESKNSHVNPEHPGLFFSLTKQGNDFICKSIDGELLKELGYHKTEIVGHPLLKILPASSSSINDYCHLSLSLQESITFELICMEKPLLISIKPSVDADGQNVILGTAMDMGGILPEKLNPKHKQNKNVRVVM